MRYGVDEEKDTWDIQRPSSQLLSSHGHQHRQNTLNMWRTTRGDKRAGSWRGRCDTTKVTTRSKIVFAKGLISRGVDRRNTRQPSARRRCNACGSRFTSFDEKLAVICSVGRRLTQEPTPTSEPPEHLPLQKFRTPGENKRKEQG